MKDKKKDERYNLEKSDIKADSIFNNLPEVISPKDLSVLIGVSIKTIYDWRYRGKTRNIPSQLFLKIGGKLLINTKILRSWILP